MPLSLVDLREGDKGLLGDEGFEKLGSLHGEGDLGAVRPKRLGRCSRSHWIVLVASCLLL